MPRRAEPDLPPGVEQAVLVFGNSVRVAVLHSLAHEGRATRAELGRRIEGMSEANLHVHIDVLEDIGVIVADPARDRDPGPVKRLYSLDVDRLDALFASLHSAVRPTA